MSDGRQPEVDFLHHWGVVWLKLSGKSSLKKKRNSAIQVLLASRHIKRENASLPVDVRCSKMPLLKVPNVSEFQVKNSGSLRLGHWKPIFQFFSQIRQGKTPRSRMRIHRKLQYWLEDFFLSRKGWQEPTYSVLNNNWGGLHFKM